MTTVNIHKAKTHLSRLVEEAARGKSFIIAKAGKPMVQVTALDSNASPKMQRLGFLSEPFAIPKDFDSMGAGKIRALFAGAAQWRRTRKRIRKPKR